MGASNSIVIPETINTKSEFTSDQMKAQVQEIKFEREKALSSGRSNTTNRSLHTVIQAVTSRPTNQPNALRSLDLVVEGLRPSDQSVYLPKLPLVNSEESDEPLEF